MSPALKLSNGLVLSAPVSAHAQVLLLAQEAGLPVETPAALGWVQLSSYRDTQRPDWPGLVKVNNCSEPHRD
jgi:hypothetical protein